MPRLTNGTFSEAQHSFTGLIVSETNRPQSGYSPGTHEGEAIKRGRLVEQRMRGFNTKTNRPRAEKLKSERTESDTMQTMIDSTVPEIANTSVPQAKTEPISEPREQMLSWLIVVASVLLLFLIYRLVMLELEVQVLLDGLYAVAGQSRLPKS
jgi:hypothetical protein